MSYNYQKSNVNLAEAIAMYEEEQAFNAAQAIQDSVHFDTDARIWQQYVQQDMDADIAAHLSEKDCDTHSVITPDDSGIRFHGKSMKAATRRQRTQRHNARMAQTAKVIVDNYLCRDHEDMQNMTFCKSRAGRPVKGPKSRTFCSDKVLKRISKMKLIPESYKADVNGLLACRAHVNKILGSHFAA